MKHIRKIKSFLNATRINVKGEHLKNKYLIIESDDWGAIRTPSKNTLDDFIERGFQLGKSVYKYDALASEADLDALFNTLQEIKDSEGRSLPLTANVCVANPDFSKIKEDGFKNYYYEHFTETFKEYPLHQNAFDKWKEAIKQNLFKPQFHCREHLNVKRWMNALRSGNPNVIYSFEKRATYSGKGDYSFMEAYDWDEKSDIIEHISIIEDGLKIFEDIFRYKSVSFVAPCYNWDPLLEPFLKSKEINILQGLRSQLKPTGEFDRYERIKNSFWSMNENGQYYNVRNCFLEPSMLPGKDWVNSCLIEIQNAFSLNKPAVICSHRINYIGYINIKNRDRGLKDLKNLMLAVKRKWPDVKFITTDELYEVVDQEISGE